MRWIPLLLLGCVPTYEVRDQPIPAEYIINPVEIRQMVPGSDPKVFASTEFNVVVLARLYDLEERPSDRQDHMADVLATYRCRTQNAKLVKWFSKVDKSGRNFAYWHFRCVE